MTAVITEPDVTVLLGDACEQLATLDAGSVQCAVTSPPYYGLRDYGVDGQIGLEASPGEYVEQMRAVFDAARRVLADDGVLWLNIGDSYASDPGAGRGSGSVLQGRKHHQAQMPTPTTRSRKPGVTLERKNLLGMPWRVAFSLQDDGWILRNDVIWHKQTAMPQSVQDRLSSRHEHVFLFSKRPRYWFDLDAIREPLLHPAAADGSKIISGKTGGAGKVGSAARIGGSMPNSYGRPQLARAYAIAEQHGLTEAHFAAIRACGMGDAGKAAETQVGTGRNRPSVQALADEAKKVLGGYYREFLTPTGKNPGDVWSLAAEPFPGAHFACMPPALARRCILAGSPEGATVLDPFTGSGTTAMVARQLGRRFVGVELNPSYIDIIRGRIGAPTLDFGASA